MSKMTLLNGYEMKTTLWEDFSIADKFGTSAILDTYDATFVHATDIEFATELAIVLNYKIWQHYELNDELAELYDTLWRNVDEYIIGDDSIFTDEEISYYYKITD